MKIVSTIENFERFQIWESETGFDIYMWDGVEFAYLETHKCPKHWLYKLESIFTSRASIKHYYGIGCIEG